MTDHTTERSRLFAKPSLEASRPGAVLPARFLPSIALLPRERPARRLPTENFLTTADRPVAAALPTSPAQN